MKTIAIRSGCRDQNLRMGSHHESLAGHRASGTCVFLVSGVMIIPSMW